MELIVAPVVLALIVGLALGWTVSELTKGCKAKRTGQVWPPPVYVGRHRRPEPVPVTSGRFIVAGVPLAQTRRYA